MATATQRPRPTGRNPHAAAPDLAALKTRQQAAWSSGNYAVVGTTLQIVGEELCEALDLRARLQSARRRRRQRHGQPGRGAPLVRRHLDRLCAGAAGTRPRARRGRGACDRFQGGRRRRPAVRRRELRYRGLDLRRDVHARTRTRPPPNCCASAGPAARSVSRTGRRKASSARCSRRSANICRRRPAPNRRRCGARARASPKCSAPAASSIKAEPRIFNFRYRSPEHFLDVFKTFYGPMLQGIRRARCRAKQSESQNDLHALIVRMNRAGDGTMVVPSEYLRGRDHQAMRRVADPNIRKIHTIGRIPMSRIDRTSVRLRVLRLLLRNLSVRARFCRGLVVPKTIDSGAAAPVHRGAGRQPAADVAVCDPAQRDGAPAIQAMVDAIGAEVDRAQHLCAVRKPRTCAAVLAVAADAGGDLERRESGYRNGPDRPFACRLADRADQHIPDQSFRAVRTASGGQQPHRSPDAGAALPDAASIISSCAIRSISASSSRSGRRRR